MGHINSVLMAVSKCSEPDGLSEDARRERLLLRVDGLGTTRWATSRSSASSMRVALSAGAPPIAPGFTLDLMAKHSLDFWLTSEDLPDPENRVTLDRDGDIVLALHAEQRRRAHSA